MNKIETKETVSVNGAIITPAIVEMLKGLQERDNAEINDWSGYIANAICLFVMLEDVVGNVHFNDKMHVCAINLSFIRDNLAALAAQESREEEK